MWGSLDWLFPPVCGGCNRPGFRWCPDCQKRVMAVPEPICNSCGMPVVRYNLCPGCRTSRPPYVALRSWLIFEGPIRNALHKLKYRRNLALGDSLAQHLAVYVRGLNWPINVITPVPLGRNRQRERGYNQVGLVAKPLAEINGWAYTPRGLKRVRETRSQVGLSVLQRKENVSGAFRADPVLLAGKTVLLMDDVATTGATLSACTEALLSAGAASVYALTIARALPRHGLQIV